MLGTLVRAIVLIIVLVAVGAFLLGWYGRGPAMDDDRPVGTTGTEAPKVDTQKAREVGAQVGEKTAAAAEQARRALVDGSLTTKIKAKMALDDTVKALDIDIDTEGSTVTLSGVVATNAQRERALQLARETDGVTRVVDRLRVRQ
jgi:hyperosmotically inducible protein